MDRRTLVALVAFGLGLGLLLDPGATTHAQPGEPITLRVLTYNIHRGVGVDDKLDLARIAEVIRSAEPDIVALQEVDRGTERSHGMDQPAILADLTGMHPVFGKAIDHQGGEYGQLILTREPPESSRVHRLPGDPQREQRIAVEVVTRKGGRVFRFVSTHLHHRADSPDRLAQAREAAALFGRGEFPVVLVGDLNDVPQSETLAAFGEGWLNATAGDGDAEPTFPAAKPTRQIDYVLAWPAERWRVKEAQVLDEPTASDHRPLLAVLEIRPTAGGDVQGE